MDTNELLRKVRKIEIKTKGLSQNIFAGEYHSAFASTSMVTTCATLTGTSQPVITAPM